MKLSTRSRYGLRALIELAAHDGDGPVNMQDIADHEQVSRKYLDTLFGSLKVAGLVSSRRGMGGGWTLTRPPSAIRLSEVMDALEGSMTLVACEEFPEACTRASCCATRQLFSEVNAAIRSVLDGTTLADMVARRRDLESSLGCAPGEGDGDDGKRVAPEDPASADGDG